MSNQGQQPPTGGNDRDKNKDELPPESIIIRQVNWAWLWSSLPWILLVAVLYAIGLLDPIFSSIILIIILVPRFLVWRGTAYIITNDALIYQRGGFFNWKRYRLPWERLAGVRAKNPLFGKGLGYETVDVLLDNRGVANMTYVPTTEHVAELIQQKLDLIKPKEGSTPPADGGDKLKPEGSDKGPKENKDDKDDKA